MDKKKFALWTRAPVTLLLGLMKPSSYIAISLFEGEIYWRLWMYIWRIRGAIMTTGLLGFAPLVDGPETNEVISLVLTHRLRLVLSIFAPARVHRLHFLSSGDRWIPVFISMTIQHWKPNLYVQGTTYGQSVVAPSKNLPLHGKKITKEIDNRQSGADMTQLMWMWLPSVQRQLYYYRAWVSFKLYLWLLLYQKILFIFAVDFLSCSWRYYIRYEKGSTGSYGDTVLAICPY